MAPERERAMDDEMGKILKRQLAEGDSCVCTPGSPCQYHGGQQSAATCSEVVERLAKLADIDYSTEPFLYPKFDRKKAEAILHSWRERLRKEQLDEIRSDPASTVCGIPMPEIMKLICERKENVSEWRERRVQELEECLENFVKMVGDGVLVRNIEDDGDMVKYLRQGTRILEVLKQADDALAKHSISPEPSSTQLDTDKGEKMATEIRNNQILDRFGNKHWIMQECEGCCSILYDGNFERCPICNTALVSFIELPPRSANDPTSQTPEETAFWQKAEDRAKSPAPANHSEVAEEIAADIRKRYEGQCAVFMDDLEEIIAPVLDEWREQIRKGANHE